MNQINKTNKAQLNIKATVSPCGNTCTATGYYLGRNDAKKEYTHRGSLALHMTNIQRMKNAGYEFMHVVIRPHSKAVQALQ